MQWTRTAGPTSSAYEPNNGNGKHGTAQPIFDDVSIKPAEPTVESQVAEPSDLENQAHRPSGGSLVDAVRRLVRQPSEQISDDSDADLQGPGIHDITKKTNQWFDREVGVLERDAKAFAADWAGKGLPRHDVARSTPLEVEQVLAGRCVETFRQWVERVRVKMSDAIAKEAEAIGSQLEDLRGSTGQLERLEADIAAIDSRVRELRAEAKADTLDIKVESLVPGRPFFWFFAIGLTVVEFFANFPVLRLLLPLNSALAKAADISAQDINTDGWFAGIAAQLKEMLLHIDAVCVALVAVLVLVLFGKTLGSGIRAYFAFHVEEQPRAAITIRAFRRHHIAAVAVAVAGIIFVLSFLFWSRATIASIAHSRVAADSLELDRLERESKQPRSPAEVAIVTARLIEQQRTLETHREDRAYATMIQNNNVPILFLNVALVLGAGLLGYLSYHRVFDGEKGENPTIVQLRANRESLQSQALNVIQDGRSAESTARAGIGRVEHLVTASPLAEWQAKVDRLSAVIPLFRGENSRLRGIDPGSILAFAGPPPLSLPVVEAEKGFPEPASFSRIKEEFEICRQNFTAVTPRISISPSDPQTV